MLGDFNAKLGTENIFKLTIGNESLHQDNNDNGVKGININDLAEDGDSRLFSTWQ
jgi:hypothetical protein